MRVLVFLTLFLALQMNAQIWLEGTEVVPGVLAGPVHRIVHEAATEAQPDTMVAGVVPWKSGGAVAFWAHVSSDDSSVMYATRLSADGSMGESHALPGIRPGLLQLEAVGAGTGALLVWTEGATSIGYAFVNEELQIEDGPFFLNTGLYPDPGPLDCDRAGCLLTWTAVASDADSLFERRSHVARVGLDGRVLAQAALPLVSIQSVSRGPAGALLVYCDEDAPYAIRAAIMRDDLFMVPMAAPMIPDSAPVTATRVPDGFLLVWVNGLSELDGALLDDAGRTLRSKRLQQLAIDPSFTPSRLTISRSGTERLIILESRGPFDVFIPPAEDPVDLDGARIGEDLTLIDSQTIPLSTNPDSNFLPSVAATASGFVIGFDSGNSLDRAARVTFIGRGAASHVADPVAGARPLATRPARTLIASVAAGAEGYLVATRQGDSWGINGPRTLIRLDASGETLEPVAHVALQGDLAAADHDYGFVIRDEPAQSLRSGTLRAWDGMLSVGPVIEKPAYWVSDGSRSSHDVVSDGTTFLALYATPEPEGFSFQLTRFAGGATILGSMEVLSAEEARGIESWSIAVTRAKALFAYAQPAGTFVSMIDTATGSHAITRVGDPSNVFATALGDTLVLFGLDQFGALRVTRLSDEGQPLDGAGLLIESRAFLNELRAVPFGSGALLVVWGFEGGQWHGRRVDFASGTTGPELTLGDEGTRVVDLVTRPGRDGAMLFFTQPPSREGGEIATQELLPSPLTLRRRAAR